MCMQCGAFYPLQVQVQMCQEFSGSAPSLKKSLIESSHPTAPAVWRTHFGKCDSTPAVSRRDSMEILVANSSIVWRPQAQEKHFQLFTCLLAVFSRTRFLHIWKAHIACTSLSSTISHFHCRHYWSYLSQPFDTGHMFCWLLNIFLIDVIRLLWMALLVVAIKQHLALLYLLYVRVLSHFVSLWLYILQSGELFFCLHPGMFPVHLAAHMRDK